MLKNRILNIISFLLFLLILMYHDIPLILTMFIIMYFIVLIMCYKVIKEKKIIFRVIYDLALLLALLLIGYLLTNKVEAFFLEISISLIFIALNIFDCKSKYNEKSINLQFCNNIIVLLLLVKYLLICIDGNFANNIVFNRYLLDQDANYIVLLSIITFIHKAFNKIKTA